MSAAPAFDHNDVAYLRSSAASGFLEKVTINTVTRHNDGWVYTLVTAKTRPQTATFGDRITHIPGNPMYLAESELMTLCDALVLAEEVLTARLHSIQSLRASRC